TVFPLRTFLQVALQATGTILAGGIAFLIISILLQSHELNEFKHAIKVRLLRKAVVQGAEEAQGTATD
ncbi:MAG: hypothetical protein NUV81_02685, partial [bacterium]|nr:hypothetical protein [bacterium]